MNMMMVRSKINEENVADAKEALGKLFQALEQAQPADVRYGTPPSGSAIAAMTLDEHVKAFVAYVAGLLGDLYRYVATRRHGRHRLQGRRHVVHRR